MLTAERKLSGKEEALLVATACSEALRGRARWTLELLADELVRLTDRATLSESRPQSNVTPLQPTYATG